MDTPPRWKDQAACKGATHLFFPVANERGRHDRIAKAKAICMTCPVRVECGDEVGPADENGASRESGIWGGVERFDVYDMARIRSGIRRQNKAS